MATLLLVSCDLWVDPSVMKGEQRLGLEAPQRARLVALFGDPFVSDSAPHLFVADFTANRNHPVLGGRVLAGVYDPSLDKIWINFWYATEGVVAHELTHRWQARVLHDDLPGSAQRSSLDYRFTEDQVTAAVASGSRLNCEQEATIVSLCDEDRDGSDPREPLFTAYLKKFLHLPE
jgi:hypothetical protein